MSSIVFLKNKKNGNVYAYVNEKVHDDTTGTDVYKRRCIGHLDPVTGKIIPNRTKDESPKPMVRPYGHTALLYNTAKEIGLVESLQIVFPDNWKTILTCAFYELCEQKPLSNIVEWIVSNDIKIGVAPDLKSLIYMISRITDYDIDSFTKVWKKRIDFSHFTVLSLSPIASYVDRVAMTFSESIVLNSAVELEVCYAGHMPFAYVRHSIGLKDAHEMFAVSNRFEKYGVSQLTRVARSALCRDSDLGELIGDKKGFSMMIPSDGELFTSLMEENVSKLFGHSDISGDGSSFTSTVRKRVNGHNVFIHFYYDAEKAESQTSAFLSMIERCKLELDHGHLVTPHNQFYENYFIITKEEGDYAKFELNSDAIMKRNDLSGFDIIITDSIADAKEAMALFEINREAEFVFDNMYDPVDRMNLKLYTLQMDQARIFIQFISLILRSAVSERYCNENGYSVNEILESLKHTYYVDMPGRKNMLKSQLTEKQKDILSQIGPL